MRAFRATDAARALRSLRFLPLFPFPFLPCRLPDLHTLHLALDAIADDTPNAKRPRSIGCEGVVADMLDQASDSIVPPSQALSMLFRRRT
ncbi:hypothetical protein C8233_06150 [Halomonas sp. SF2003]|nr:hypothetical protein C8233_06150 [Halomonas sp. SF2003]